MESITISRKKKRNNSNNKKRVVTNIINTKTTKRRRKRNNKRRKSPPNPLVSYAKLIADPCSGPLIRAIGNGSVVERVRATYTCNLSGTATAGYCVWFPDFHNPGFSANTAFNTFLWEGANSASVPTNTVTNPLGMVSVTTTGSALVDPAAPLVAGAAFSRAQSLAACMQMDYLGALSAISGQVAIIKNFPFKAFATSNTSGTIVPPTVDDLFSYASTRERIQITGHEVIWRPTDATSVLRDDGNSKGYTGSAPDSAFTTGTPTSTVSVTSAVNPNVFGICIAWKGIPATASCFQLNLIKAVNLELSPSGNTLEPTFAGSDMLDDGPTPIDHITSWLDKTVPQWQSKALNGAVNVVGGLAKAYTQNVGVSMARPGIRGRSQLLLEDW